MKSSWQACGNDHAMIGVFGRWHLRGRIVRKWKRKIYYWHWQSSPALVQAVLVVFQLTRVPGIKGFPGKSAVILRPKSMELTWPWGVLSGPSPWSLGPQACPPKLDITSIIRNFIVIVICCATMPTRMVCLKAEKNWKCQWSGWARTYGCLGIRLFFTDSRFTHTIKFTVSNPLRPVRLSMGF